jgi:predicted metalloprotease with PDZ domain
VITYRIDLADRHAHLLQVRLTIAQPAALQTVSLPVWIPGSYLVREFARHLSQLEAHQGSRSCHITQHDKTTWHIRCEGRAALVLSYRIYAFDPSVRAAFLGPQRGFFNGTSVCLRVHGREQEPHTVQLKSLPKHWQVATAMAPSAAAHTYASADYDELVDHPFELGPFWRGQFKAAGVPHDIIVSGALPDFDGRRLLRDTQRICEAEIAFWHSPKKKPPFKRYVFLLNAVEDNYGGLEHRASTALIASRRDLPALGSPESSDGYITLLGLISHEYFHTWNVKRLRPAEFTDYDYTQENYTELLWFFEGFTSYYDDLFLLRCGHIDAPRYLGLLAKTATAVLSAPGRHIQSVAQSSVDAWTKYYRPDENTPNLTVNYYTKGTLIALALDLTLRTEGKGTLDHVMRALWQRSQGGPISEQDIVDTASEIAGRSLRTELTAWVHGTLDLPLAPLLKRFAILWSEQPPTMAQQLGLRVTESALTGIKITHVLHGGPAQQAGLAAGDELLGVSGWRLRRLDEVKRLSTPGGSLPFLVSRDQRLITILVTLPSKPAGGAVSLQPQPASTASASAQALRLAWWQG